MQSLMLITFTDSEKMSLLKFWPCPEDQKATDGVNNFPCQSLNQINEGTSTHHVGMATDGHYVLQSMKLKEKNNDHVS